MKIVNKIRREEQDILKRQKRNRQLELLEKNQSQNISKIEEKLENRYLLEEKIVDLDKMEDQIFSRLNFESKNEDNDPIDKIDWFIKEGEQKRLKKKSKIRKKIQKSENFSSAKKRKMKIEEIKNKIKQKKMGLKSKNTSPRLIETPKNIHPPKKINNQNRRNSRSRERLIDTYYPQKSRSKSPPLPPRSPPRNTRIEKLIQRSKYLDNINNKWNPTISDP